MWKSFVLSFAVVAAQTSGCDCVSYDVKPAEGEESSTFPTLGVVDKCDAHDARTETCKNKSAEEKEDDKMAGFCTDNWCYVGPECDQLDKSAKGILRSGYLIGHGIKTPTA